MKLRLGSLFSGIGGIELGLERTGGFETVFQVEQDEYCRRVLARHWPDVARFNDVREVGARELPACDVIAGGFPCQDISLLGKGAGIDGDRSGLWSEFARIIRELRPAYALVENSPALAGRGLDRVLGDLAEIGYDAEWSVLSACALGAPHPRERMYVLAYTSGVGMVGDRATLSPSETARGRDDHAGGVPSYAWRQLKGVDQSGVLRLANGIPGQVGANRGYGNAVVPQVAEYIGHRLLAFHSSIQAVA
jgi:DNA (cytosine-5)-methyltransferase 1